MGRLDDPVMLTRYDRIIRGQRREVPVATPAVGQEWSVPVPVGRMWRIVGGSLRLVTSAVVANRNAAYGVLRDAVVLGGWGNSTAIAASSTQVFCVQESGTLGGGGPVKGIIQLPAPLYVVQGGLTIQSLTTNIDAGDQWSNLELMVDEFYFDNTGLSYEEVSEREAIEQAWEQSAGSGGKGR